MHHSQKNAPISFMSVPEGLLSLANTLYQDSMPAIVILSLTEIHNQTQQMLAHWLHPKEQQQLSNFKYEKRNREWLGGRICAKRGLRTFLQQRKKSSFIPYHHQCRIMAEESGRPYFSSCEAGSYPLPELSISHSKGCAASMISQSHCGIDIQYPAQSLQKVKDRFITDEEEQLLNRSLSNRPLLSRLVLTWAGKEAVKKMFSHTGMLGFHEIIIERIVQKNTHDTILYFSRADTPKQAFPVIAGMLDNDYSLALCCLLNS